MRKSFLIIVCLLFVSAFFVYSQSAVELNRLGFSHYQKGEYEKAIEYFRQSVQKDTNYATAHFNLVCTLSLVLKDFELGNKEYFERIDLKDRLTDEALKHLERSLELDSFFRTKALSDPDLEYLREKYAYYRMLGYRQDNLNDVFEILTGVSHWAVEGGAADPMHSIEFNRDLTFSYHSFLEQVQGRFFLTREAGWIIIVVVFPEERNGRKRFTFRFLDKNGNMEIDDSFWGGQPVYGIFEPNYRGEGA